MGRIRQTNPIIKRGDNEQFGVRPECGQSSNRTNGTPSRRRVASRIRRKPFAFIASRAHERRMQTDDVDRIERDYLESYLSF